MKGIPYILVGLSYLVSLATVSPVPQQKLNIIHRRFEKDFGKSAGNGFSRMAHINSVRDPRLFQFVQKNNSWEIKEVALIGMLTGDATIYQTPDLPKHKGMAKDELAQDNIRQADEFEKVAIAKVQHDGLLVTEIGKDEIRMVGALRATENCLKCHNQKVSADQKTVESFEVGDVLGALSYRIKRRTQP